MIPLKALEELRNYAEHRHMVRGYERSLYRFLVRSICLAFDIDELSVEVDSNPGRFVPDITFLYLKSTPWAAFEVKPGADVSSERAARKVFREKLKYIQPTMRYFFLMDQRTLYRWDLSGTILFEDSKRYELSVLYGSRDAYEEAFGCFREMLDSEAADRGFLELLRSTHQRSVPWQISIPEASGILNMAVKDLLKDARTKAQEVRALVQSYREMDDGVPEYGVDLTGDDPFAWVNQPNQMFFSYATVQEIVEPYAPYVRALVAAGCLISDAFEGNPEKAIDVELAHIVTDYILAVLIDDRCYDSYSNVAGIFSSYAIQCQARGEPPMTVVWGRLRKCSWLKVPPAVLRFLDSADTALSSALLRAMLCINGTDFVERETEEDFLRAAHGLDPLWKSVLDPFCGYGIPLSLVVRAGVQKYKQNGFTDHRMILDWLKKIRGYTSSAHRVPIVRFHITEAVARELPGIDRASVFKSVHIEHKEVSAADFVPPADVVVCKPPADRIQGQRKQRRKQARYRSLSDMMRQKERLRAVWGMANKTVGATSVILNGEDKLLNDGGSLLLVLPRSSLTSQASESIRQFWVDALTQVHDNRKRSRITLLGDTSLRGKRGRILWIDEYGAREVDQSDILSGSYREGPSAIVPPDPTPTKVFRKMFQASHRMGKPTCFIPLEGVEGLKDPQGDLEVLSSGNIRPWGVSGPPKMLTTKALLNTAKINRHNEACNPAFVAVRTHPFLRLCPYENGKIFSSSTLFIEVKHDFPLHVYCCSRLVQTYLANYFSNGYKKGDIITWGKAILDHFPLPFEIGDALKELGNDIERLDRLLALGRKDLEALCDTPLRDFIGKKVLKEGGDLVVKDPMFKFIVSRSSSENDALNTLVPGRSYEQAVALYKGLTTERPRLKEEFQGLCLKLEHLVGAAFGLSQGEVEDALACIKTSGMPFLQEEPLDLPEPPLQAAAE